jgi:hypothetical protein
MYNKNLTEDLRLRLSSTDMDFLRALSAERSCSVSEVIRSIIGEYRRSVDALRTLQDALTIMSKKEGAVHGDTKTDFDDKL